MIDIALLCTIFGVFILFSFIKGVSIGQKLKKEEAIDISLKNPIKVIKEHREFKKQCEQAEKETEENEINLYNIDVYDGTGLGQKDFR